MIKPNIEIRNLTKRFGRLTAVDNVSIDILPNEIFGLIGPNGAGKTTIIKMLTCLYPMNNGSIKIFGLDVDKDVVEVRKRIGVMLDEPPLFDYLTVYESLVLHGKMQQVKESELKERINEILNLFYLKEERNKLVLNLSLGNRKKLAFALSILHNPPILFIDEPLLNVDVLTVNIIKDVIKRFRGKENGTVFLTSHILTLVEELCDRIAIMNNGKIIFCGTLSDLKKELLAKDEDKLDKIFFKILNIQEKEDILKWLK